MITRVEGISDGQLWRISQMIGEAFVSSFRRACSSECFHRFPIAGICNEGTRRGSSLGPGKECESHTFLRKTWVYRNRREKTGRWNIGVSCAFEEKGITRESESGREK